MLRPADPSALPARGEVSRARGRWLTPANALTLLRLAAAPACAVSLWQARPVPALAFFALAVASDLVDGPLARRCGDSSPLGALLDHATDAVFVATGLAALALLGLVPAALPALVGLAFLQYALDSRALQGRRLRTSLLGRSNGIAYYVLLGIPVVRGGIGVDGPPDAWIRALGWVLVATTLVSMAERGYAWLASLPTQGRRNSGSGWR